MKLGKANSLLAQAQTIFSATQNNGKEWVAKVSAMLADVSVTQKDIYREIRSARPIFLNLKRLPKVTGKLVRFYEKADADSYTRAVALSDSVREENKLMREHLTDFCNRIANRSVTESALGAMVDRLDEITETLKEPTRKARGTQITKSLPRVYICWDKKMSSPIDKVISDLLSQDIGKDCVVSYYDSFQEIPEEYVIVNELHDTQLVVLLVTNGFLQQNFKKDTTEVRCVKEIGVPILPVVISAGLFSSLTEQEGAIHGVSMDDPAYRTKLGEQINNFIVSGELIKEVKEKAFSGRIFLSYRKKDIDHARKFIASFHDISGNEAIAVWYDNYLTAGRIFGKEINEAIDEADVFVLLVTPTLFQKNDMGEENYVLREELPYAQKENKHIVAIEAVPIDRELSEYIRERADKYVTIDELTDFPVDLFKPKAETDEQTYLLGMAYRYGIFVEQNFERALTFLSNVGTAKNEWGIRSSIEGGRLWEHIPSSISYVQAITSWMQVLFTQQELLGYDHPDVAVTLINLARLEQSNGEMESALEHFEHALRINEEALGTSHPQTAFVLDNIGSLYADKKEWKKALEFYNRALKIREAKSKASYETANSYNNTAIVYKELGDYKTALALHEKAYDINEKLLGKEDQFTIISMKNIACIYLAQGKIKKANKKFGEVIDIQTKTYGADSLELAQTCVEIATYVLVEGSSDKYTLDLLLSAKENREKLLPFEHPDVAEVYSWIAVAYAMQGMHNDAGIFDELAVRSNEQCYILRDTLSQAYIYGNSAAVALYRDDYDSAIDSLNVVLSIQESVLGADHPQTIETRDLIAAKMFEKEKTGLGE